MLQAWSYHLYISMMSFYYTSISHTAAAEFTACMQILFCKRVYIHPFEEMGSILKPLSMDRLNMDVRQMCTKGPSGCDLALKSGRVQMGKNLLVSYIFVSSATINVAIRLIALVRGKLPLDHF